MRISASGKEWKLPTQCQVEDEVVAAANGSKLLANILVKRGIQNADEAQAFLNCSSYIPTSPMELQGMSGAVERINQAIVNKENITVYGDYDVDGVTATSVLVSTLRLLGAQVDFYIPNRTEEGYGLNLKAVSILASKRRTKLIITCDCGISNFAEINFAKSLGLDTIIVDHHTMPDLLPPAVAILHPKQLAEHHPLFHLPGVGVAYKLCEALFLDKGTPELTDKLLDFVTLGMIADLVPLVKENRYLVQIGLPKLIESPRPGLKALLAQVKNNGGTDVVGFGLAPRINAVGRLSDANRAVELMITEDESQALVLANQLQNENTKRQELCEQVLQEAEQMVSAKIDLEKDRAIVIYKQGWHHGVVGIVASRLVDKYYRPVFIGELDEINGVIKGSARGIESIDLYAVLKANEQLMTRWGGHKMAAGFSLESSKGEAFIRAITGTCNKVLEDKTAHPVLDIELVATPDQVTLELAETLTKLAPFGMANKKPVLMLQDISCVQSRLLGKEGKHSRIMLSATQDQQLQFESVFWNSKGRIPPDGANIDIIFTPEINSYNNRDRLQLVLLDWRLSNEPAAEAANSQQLLPADDQELPPKEPLEIAPIPQLIKNEESTPHSASILTWKDLRSHENPIEVVTTAVRKLANNVAIFAETTGKISAVEFIDRTNKTKFNHLLIWQYPPSIQVLQNLLLSTKAQNIYLVGGAQVSTEDPMTLIKKLLGLVRYAVNQKEGKAQGDKLAAALGTSKMVIALGLTILKKITVIDWFAEEGLVYLDIIDQPSGLPEEVPEYRQLLECLKELQEFRSWCADASVKDLQLAIAPNRIELGSIQRRQEEVEQYQDPAKLSTST